MLTKCLQLPLLCVPLKKQGKCHSVRKRDNEFQVFVSEILLIGSISSRQEHCSSFYFSIVKATKENLSATLNILYLSSIHSKSCVSFERLCKRQNKITLITVIRKIKQYFSVTQLLSPTALQSTQKMTHVTTVSLG